MTCVEAEKMVVPYMKDELSPTELEDFLDHIHTCENCREELEIHYMVDVGLKKLDEADGTYDIVGDLKGRGILPFAAPYFHVSDHNLCSLNADWNGSDRHDPFAASDLEYVWISVKRCLTDHHRSF